ncbi:alpha/beta fold hydrolase [Streptomyces physcomitrii]|uniref:Alpha/beta hydrolase n=1 Tax=Streptomyces physcomitrii TaxID=2724184 RepID=A0ABX1HAW6_9ACTN|nr:alpha/beta hydrolase [Streptomyces physcomitrii]NKI45187.1 alpha/beta hydrolase [Streptomyces physcomitrii]
MRQTRFDGKGSRIRWTESVGAGPARVFVHGLGSASAVQHAHLGADPRLAGRRTLYVDLPGHGISDRPADFGYTLAEHADALAAVLDFAATGPVQLVAHSMGGAVALVLARRRPELVGGLVLTEANLDPDPPAEAGSSRIAAYTEADFLAFGFPEVLDRVGAGWAATMRLTDPLALHRSAVSLVRGSRPVMREILRTLPQDRVYVQGGRSGPLDGAEELVRHGVRVVTVPGAGHNVMFDRPEAFAEVLAAN